jgi:hypothetical protein
VSPSSRGLWGGDALLSIPNCEVVREGAAGCDGALEMVVHTASPGPTAADTEKTEGEGAPSSTRVRVELSLPVDGLAMGTGTHLGESGAGGTVLTLEYNERRHAHVGSLAAVEPFSWHSLATEVGLSVMLEVSARPLPATSIRNLFVAVRWFTVVVHSLGGSGEHAGGELGATRISVSWVVDGAVLPHGLRLRASGVLRGAVPAVDARGSRGALHLPQPQLNQRSLLLTASIFFGALQQEEESHAVGMRGVEQLLDALGGGGDAPAGRGRPNSTLYS